MCFGVWIVHHSLGLLFACIRGKESYRLSEIVTCSTWISFLFVHECMCRRSRAERTHLGLFDQHIVGLGGSGVVPRTVIQIIPRRLRVCLALHEIVMNMEMRCLPVDLSSLQ